MRNLPYLIALIAFSTVEFASCSHPSVPPVPLPDTTSHNFLWQIDTLGEGGASILNDVFIIDENNIWAVGELYLRDSLGQIDQTPYNLAIRNGSNWSLRRVPYNYGGGIVYNPISSIFAFGPNDVWLCGNGISHWDGSRYTEMPVPTAIWGPYEMAKVWGTSSSDLYMVGDGGCIAHFDGSRWTKLQSGTTTNIRDIWGGYDWSTGQVEILAVASRKHSGYGLDLLRIKGTTVQKVDTAGLRLSESSLWFLADGVHYVVGDGVFSKESILDPVWEQQTGHPLIYKEMVRGNAWNDIFVSGDFGLMSHYNGSTWQHYNNSTLPLNDGILKGLCVKGDIVVAVGVMASGRGVAVRGVRAH